MLTLRDVLIIVNVTAVIGFLLGGILFFIVGAMIGVTVSTIVFEKQKIRGVW